MLQTYKTDVLVIGGGPAATWAALKASQNGASVVLVDKGYCGTSGATAPSGTGVWTGIGDPYNELIIENYRLKIGGLLAEKHWKERVKEQAKRNIVELGESGFPDLLNENLGIINSSLPGPQYMKHMRKLVKKAKVNILDHAPALELLVDENGTVGGAHGTFLDKEDVQWRVEAGAVVIATGGCAYLSNALGCNVNTGDGYLMAAEVGAELSGMEFGSMYGISADFSSITKNALFRYGRYYHEDGTVVQETELLSETFTAANVFKVQTMLAKRLPHEKVYCRLELAPPEMWPQLRKMQPNFFLPFEKKGINPFTEKFELKMRQEGTVRGTGGINIEDEYCSTRVPGLFAAGDAATRELIAGAFSGGGSHNAAWAMTSGVWAGIGASNFAKTQSHERKLISIPSIPLQSLNSERKSEDFVKAIQEIVFPLERNFFKTQETIDEDLTKLDWLWNELKQRGLRYGKYSSYEREVAAMIATARWTLISASERTETRGLHNRLDYPNTDPNQRHRIIIKGIEQPQLRFEKVQSEVYV